MATKSVLLRAVRIAALIMAALVAVQVLLVVVVPDDAGSATELEPLGVAGSETVVNVLSMLLLFAIITAVTALVLHRKQARDR